MRRDDTGTHPLLSGKSPGPRPLRVLHCPEIVGGLSAEIARNERALGADSVAVSFRSSPYGFPIGETIWAPNASLLQREIGRYRLLARAASDFDVIHYNFGSPILNWGPLKYRPSGIFGYLADAYGAVNAFIEMPILKTLGKVIAVTFQGDDARQADYSLSHFRFSIADEVSEGYYTARSDRIKRERIARFDRFADLIYALNPDLLHVLPQRAHFLPYGHIDLNQWKRSGERVINPRPLLVHAPSHQGAKGTKYVTNAVNRLRGEGIEFDFQLVEGLTRDEARELYERADIVVDQLLAGWYGGFATEMMALEIPVVCYLREEDLRFIPEGMRQDLPVINADPQTIERVLRFWLTRPLAALRERGQLGRKFVERWHDPQVIAARLLSDYQLARSA